MTQISATSTELDAQRLAQARPELRRQALRELVGEAVGGAFFGEMMKLAHNGKFKSELFHGGRGEDVFRGQLDMELARRMGQGMKNSIVDAACRRLDKGS